MTEFLNMSVKNECPICYEIIGEKNNCNTPCGHIFCFSCITKALSKNNTCPCCRENLVDQNIDEYNLNNLNNSNIIIFHDEDGEDEIEEIVEGVEQMIYGNIYCPISNIPLMINRSNAAIKIDNILYDFKSYRSYIINEIRKYFDILDSSKIKKFKNCNLKTFSKIYINDYGSRGFYIPKKYNKNQMKHIYNIFFKNSKNIVDFVDYNKYLSDKFIKQKKLQEKNLQKKIKNNKTSNKPYFRI
jgi:hypothetical protein